jgi:hypothetical protein
LAKSTLAKGIVKKKNNLGKWQILKKDHMINDKLIIQDVADGYCICLPPKLTLICARNTSMRGFTSRVD